MNFNKESKSEKKKKMWGEGGRGGGGGGGGGGGRNIETKTVSQTVKRGKRQKQEPSTQCKACGTINISKYVNNF